MEPKEQISWIEYPAYTNSKQALVYGRYFSTMEQPFLQIMVANGVPFFVLFMPTRMQVLRSAIGWEDSPALHAELKETSSMWSRIVKVLERGKP